MRPMGINDSSDMGHDNFETPELNQADFDALIPGNTEARYNNPIDWLCLPKKLMPALVTEFVKVLELEETNKYCSCEWIIHPADVAEGLERPRRMRKGEPALDCMIHTKEGFLLGFTHWLFYMRNQDDMPHNALSNFTGVRNEPGIVIAPNDGPKGLLATYGTMMTDEDFAAFMERWQQNYKPHGAQVLIHSEVEHVYRDCPNPWECETHKGFVDAVDFGPTCGHQKSMHNDKRCIDPHCANSIDIDQAADAGD